MDYWRECIAEAMEDAEVVATKEQIDIIASWAEGAHDNYSMAKGYDVIQSPVETEKDRKINSLKDEIKSLNDSIHTYRKSVAIRRNVSIQDVHIENGDVIYARF